MQVLPKLPSPSAWRLLADSSNRAPQYSLPRMIPSIYCCKDRSLSAAAAACKSKRKIWMITQRRVRNWKWTTKFWQYKIWFRISLCKALASYHNGDLEEQRMRRGLKTLNISPNFLHWERTVNITSVQKAQLELRSRVASWIQIEQRKLQWDKGQSNKRRGRYFTQNVLGNKSKQQFGNLTVCPPPAFPTSGRYKTSSFRIGTGKRSVLSHQRY